MPTASLFSQLDLGKRSLQSQQAGMNVAGHNIANIGNEHFSRQRVDLDPQHPLRSRFGTGVDLTAVERITDRFLNERLIGEQARGGELKMREDGLRRLENLFNDAEGLGLRGPLNDFWNAWGQLANKPESEIFRQEVINASKSLSRRFQDVHKELAAFRMEMNGRLAVQVDKINQLARQLVDQNRLIQQTERGSGQTNDLRDAREATLKELSRLIEIDWVENEKQLVTVSVGEGWPLVVGRRANQLEASFANDELGMFSLRGVDSKGISADLTDTVRGGEMRELIDLRDKTSIHFIDKVNQLASELAFKVNRIHATGTGLNTTFDLMRSSFALRADALNKPLPFLKDGKFSVQVLDGETNEFLELYEIDVRAGQDTVGDIVNRINQVVGDPNIFEARLEDDGSVVLASKNPTRFVLGKDETEFSVVMGFNNFFESLEGAKDFRINDRLVENPNQITAGINLLPGDNSKALEIHGLQFLPNMQGNSITFDEFYNATIAELGLMVNRNTAESQSQKLVVDQFQQLRDEVSSVNMDEEVADMVQFQRGFDAAARFISTVDEMTRTVINM
ncbi:MAG: flagellar hook-associated protein FlgK [SAR324 cluster bacterium]|nr:flagellar hook-associated protein FlgK [SAR324 cluster bacterium]